MNSKFQHEEAKKGSKAGISRERVRKNSLKWTNNATSNGLRSTLSLLDSSRLRFNYRTALQFGNQPLRWSLNATQNLHWRSKPLRQNTESKPHK